MARHPNMPDNVDYWDENAPWNQNEEMSVTPDFRPIDNLITNLVRLGLPWLPAEEANQRIVDLAVEILRLKAIIEAQEMREEPNNV